MLSVDQALKIILKHSNCLEEEKLPLLDSLGQAAAETLKAEINVPAFDSAAMDGYAVRSVDIKGATSDAPGILKVIDTVMAGSVIHSSITPGTAIRIMTGAELPAGADCVVRFEDTDEEKRRGSSPRKSQTAIGIQSEISTGKNIRKAG